MVRSPTKQKKNIKHGGSRPTVTPNKEATGVCFLLFYKGYFKSLCEIRSVDLFNEISIVSF